MKRCLYKSVKCIAILVDIVILFLLCGIVYFNAVMPESYSITNGENVNFISCLSFKESRKDSINSSQKEIYFLNSIPIKSVSVNLVDRKTVMVSGKPFGIKMITNGLMIVGLTDVISENGRINPAKLAGIDIGDTILSIDGKKIHSNEQLGTIVQKSGGKELDFLIMKKGEVLRKKVLPVKSVGDKEYRVGVWVRDSSAGIGILTFIDKNRGVFAGLGHPVCDIDNGFVMPLKSGEIMQTVITGCTKGKSGLPGELKGRFEGYGAIGEIRINSETGIYGTFDNNIFEGKELPIAYSDEIKTGSATIITTVGGDTPNEYRVQIEKIRTSESATQNMVVKVIDERLIEKCGGIVQGMSGSPIIQDGKLVGAVTHVFVNDPTRGYGIFIENMLDTANKIEIKNTD